MSLDIANLMGKLLVPAAVFGVLGLLRRYLPARQTKPQAQFDSHGDVEDFTSANFAVYACMVVVGIAFAFSAHWALVAGNRHFAEADGPAAFQFFPSGAIWWIFPGFGSVCLSWEITLFLWSLFEGRRTVVRFIDWTSERAGYDSTRALRWMTVFMAMPIGIASLLAIPMHSTLRDSDIEVGHYATLVRQSLPYVQARRLLLVDGFRNRYGKFSAAAGMIVDFDNGSRWSSSDIGDFKSKVDPGLPEFLQRKTGLPLERAETEADFRTLRR
jgi:hypothetical protein